MTAGGLSMVRFASLLWVGIMAVALFTRPHLPVDETRYLAVAWEMWLRGDFLVPYLNGEPYSHKPPLLFWLMQAGWQLFGVTDWWPRLIAPLFGLACLFLVRNLARLLWPTDRRAQELSPLLLIGCVFWTLFVTLTMFDMMLAFFALVGLLGVVKAGREQGLSGFVLIALAVGFGILTKGPAILLHILPVALTAPLWIKRMGDQTPPVQSSTGAWYLKLLLACLLGIGLALAWAIPAGRAGGEAYQHAIFWGQAAGRMVESFAHQRPFWWFAAILPGLVVPWVIWPPLWRAAGSYGQAHWRDGGSLICLIWLGTAFVAFSLISGKQLHYLLPEFPAMALLAARWLSQGGEQGPYKPSAQRLPAVLFVLLGLVLIILPLGVLPSRMPVWVGEINGYWGALVTAVAVAVQASPLQNPTAAVARLVVLPVTLVVALHLALAPVLTSRYDLKPIARQLKGWQDKGLAIANFGKYHGQFQFLGRLKQRLHVVGLRDNDLAVFLRDNPDGRIVAYYKKIPDRAKPVAVYPFRRGFMVIWDANTMRRHPGIGNRS